MAGTFTKVEGERGIYVDTTNARRFKVVATTRTDGIRPLVTPDAAGAFAVDRPALPAKQHMRGLPTPPRVPTRQPSQPSTQLLLLRRARSGRAALRRAVLPHDATGAPFGNPETPLQDHHGPAATFRGQKFPSANS